MRSNHSLRALVTSGALASFVLVGSTVPVAAADPALYLVKNIRPGSGGSSPGDLVTVGNWQTNVTLYFSASDGTSGRELWTSDGSRTGTRRVKDIRAGSGSSNPREVTAVGERIFFTANDGSRGRELWITDGTAAGTKRVKDIRPGAKGSNPLQLTAVGSTLFFTADDGSRGRELWKSDGTATGTRLVRNINRATPWTGDQSSFFADRPGDLISFKGRLFFSPVEIFIGQYDGYELAQVWVSDGTSAGTKPFRGWSPNLQELDSVYWPEEFTKVGSRLFFRAGETGLWRSDGTELGTRWMGDVSPQELTNVGGTLFFQGNEWEDVNGDTSSTNEGLWKSNGTRASTVLVKAFPPPAPWCCAGTVVSELTNVDGTLYFTSGEDVWRSDGTAAGTVRVVDLPSGVRTANLTSVGPAYPGRLYFTVDGRLRTYQFRSYGTYQDVSNVTNLTDVGGVLMFSATDGSRGQELWALVEGD